MRSKEEQKAFDENYMRVATLLVREIEEFLKSKTKWTYGEKQLALSEVKRMANEQHSKIIA